MSYVAIVAFGYAIVLILSAFAGFSVLRPKLRFFLKVLAWIATVAQIIFIFVGGGIYAGTLTCACLALIARSAVDFVIGAIILGRNEAIIDDDLKIYDGKLLAIVAVAMLAIILGWIIYALMSLTGVIVSAVNG